MNNRNYVCITCRTVSRTWGTFCNNCEQEMHRVNRAPKRNDDAAWSALAAELRARDERNAAWEWRAFVERCPVR